MNHYKTITFAGLLCLHSNNCEDDLLYLSSLRHPLAQELDDCINGKQVTVRYWISDEKLTKDEVQEDFLKSVMGIAKTSYGAHYSEITGYLWTDEECKIGGHDLIYELKHHVGRWLILEIQVHASKK